MSMPTGAVDAVLEEAARNLYNLSSLRSETLLGWWDLKEKDREHFRQRVRDEGSIFVSAQELAEALRGLLPACEEIASATRAFDTSPLPRARAALEAFDKRRKT